MEDDSHCEYPLALRKQHNDLVKSLSIRHTRGAEGGGDSDISNGWSPDSLDGRTETAKLSNRHMQHTVTFDAVDNEVQDNRQLDEAKVNSA